MVYPPAGVPESAELLLPLPDEGDRLQAEMWERLAFDRALEAEE